MFQREELLIGQNNLEKLMHKTVLVLGVGGVGGYVIEGLVRAGIRHIILVDYDRVDISNINRQIIALHSNIGKLKVECFKERIHDINPECETITYPIFYNDETSSLIFENKIDYVVDCCDSLNSKKTIIEECIKRHIKVISSMGAGNRIHPDMFTITSLKKTSYDPLARKLRFLLKNNKEALEIPVAYSKEESVKGLPKIGSISFVPSTAGLLLCSHVILDLLKGD